MFDQFHNLMIYFHLDRPESSMNFSGNLYLSAGKLGIDLCFGECKWNLCYSERTKQRTEWPDYFVDWFLPYFGYQH